MRRQRRRLSFTDSGAQQQLRLLRRIGHAVATAPLDLYRAILRVEAQEERKR